MMMLFFIFYLKYVVLFKRHNLMISIK